MRPSSTLITADENRSCAAIRQTLEQAGQRARGEDTSEERPTVVGISGTTSPFDVAGRLAASWMTQVRRHLAARDFDAARRYLGAAIAARPSDPEPHTLLGILYAARGDESEARSCFECALTIAPDAERARVHLHQLEAGTRPVLADGGGVFYTVSDPEERFSVSDVIGFVFDN